MVETKYMDGCYLNNKTGKKIINLVLLLKFCQKLNEDYPNSDSN